MFRSSYAPATRDIFGRPTIGTKLSPPPHPTARLKPTSPPAPPPLPLAIKSPPTIHLPAATVKLPASTTAHAPGAAAAAAAATTTSATAASAATSSATAAYEPTRHALKASIISRPSYDPELSNRARCVVRRTTTTTTTTTTVESTTTCTSNVHLPRVNTVDSTDNCMPEFTPTYIPSFTPYTPISPSYSFVPSEYDPKAAQPSSLVPSTYSRTATSYSSSPLVQPSTYSRTATSYSSSFLAAASARSAAAAAPPLAPGAAPSAVPDQVPIVDKIISVKPDVGRDVKSMVKSIDLTRLVDDEDDVGLLVKSDCRLKDAEFKVARSSFEQSSGFLDGLVEIQSCCGIYLYANSKTGVTFQLTRKLMDRLKRGLVRVVARLFLPIDDNRQPSLAYWSGPKSERPFEVLVGNHMVDVMSVKQPVLNNTRRKAHILPKPLDLTPHILREHTLKSSAVLCPVAFHSSSVKTHMVAIYVEKVVPLDKLHENVRNRPAFSRHWSKSNNSDNDAVNAAAAAADAVKVADVEHDDDDDIHVIESSYNLCCPISTARMVVAVRGIRCAHKACFDLSTFLENAISTGIWQCPICYVALPCPQLRGCNWAQHALATYPNVLSIKLAPDYTIIPPCKEESTKRKQSQNDDGVTKRIKLIAAPPPPPPP